VRWLDLAIGLAAFPKNPAYNRRKSCELNHQTRSSFDYWGRGIAKMSPEKPIEQRILVVDDDHEIVHVLRDYLEQSGYRVLTAHDGETALHIIRRDRPTLIVLDLMLPDRDGWDITRIVRSDRRLRRIPIIMLTARAEDTDKIVGLELGADDYITKPFNPREVVARVRSTLRRTYEYDDSATLERVLCCGDLRLGLATRDVETGGGTVNLTPTEFKLLHALMAHPSYVMTRADLIEKAFGYTYDITDRTLDNHIRNLRKKIEPDPNNPTYIQTVYGVGYRLLEPES
jgi:two-component system alkaline phosphatase synthesis response regulator PhoP